LRYLFCLLLFSCLLACTPPDHSSIPDAEIHQDTLTIDGLWEAGRAQAWFDNHSRPLGANYNNRDAINQLEMWQTEAFAPDQIDEELGWAAGIGMNSMRVYLHNLVWEQDSSGYKERLEQYLDIADKHGISTTFVLFDAVWDPVANLGPQPEPKARVHNSGWVQSPPVRQLMNGDRYYRKGKRYVQGILRHFKDDQRIYMWDLYNEPDNDNFGKFPNEPKNKAEFIYPLLVNTFRWAREINPSQPLTVGVWWGPLFNEIDKEEPLTKFNAFQLANSDIISYHSYRDKDHHAKTIKRLSSFGRPLVCTEYIARTHGSTFEDILPLLSENNVGAYNWGLVAGKTNTIYPWASWDSTFTAEPHLWHHDVFYPDGRAYSEAEVELIRISGKGLKE
jgi:hypothetical protein